MKITSTTDHHLKTERPTSKRANTSKIAVIGLGYVGLPLALRADRMNYSVIGYDIDETLVTTLKEHTAPPFLNAHDMGEVQNHNILVSTDPSVIAGADVCIICVPTPVLKNHEPDLRPLLSACETLGPYLRKDMLVIIESTVNPGVCDEIVLPILMGLSSLTPERDFLFAYCPERINPGDTDWDVRSIPRVLGAVGPKSRKRAHELYQTLIDAPIHLMENVKEAEAVKIMENSFRDINIAFINELAMSFKKLDIDIAHVLEGASTKPFGFMPHYPGCGVGGHCIPVDPYYLIAYAKQNGFTHRFLETARNINNYMPYYTIGLLEDALHTIHKDLYGSKIALLGLSYKRNVPDERESPALVILDELIHRGGIVKTFDPYLSQRSNSTSLKEALTQVDAVLIATDHKEFSSLTPDQLKQYGIPIIIDGRNCLDKEAFRKANITYHGIGR